MDLNVVPPPPPTEVVAITGAAHANTTPAIAEGSMASLKQRGVRARFEAVDGAGHGLSSLAEAATRAVNQSTGR